MYTYIHTYNIYMYIYIIYIYIIMGVPFSLLKIGDRHPKNVYIYTHIYIHIIYT